MSIKLDIYNKKAEKAGSLEVSDEVFAIEMNEALVHQAVITQMANERQVLAHTKGRAEVRGGGRKPWRQKGTGRARAGSNRSPIWIGGGITFGPTKERNFSKKLNKKMKQKALLIALSDRVKNDSIIVLDNLDTEEFKTKVFDDILKNIEKNILKIETNISASSAQKESVEKKEDSKKDEKKKRVKVKKYKRSFLIINDKKDEKTKYSVRNLAGVKFININNINIVEILKYKNLIVTKAVIEKLEKQYK